MKLLFTVLFAVVSVVGLSAKTIKVACVGNSVTYGATIENREVNSYPAKLQKMLGDNYEVGNFGKSGATLLKKGHRPYVDQKEYSDALAFNPDVVVIHLGLNDTDPRNWPNYKEEFISDYRDIIDSFKSLDTAPDIYICKMTPITSNHPRFKSGTREWFWQIQDKIEVVAKGSSSELIDLHSVLYSREDLLPDNIHPKAKGAEAIATKVYQRLTGDYGGLEMPIAFGDGMVMQRGVEIPVWGEGNSGDKVTVVLDGDKMVTEVDKFGKWKVEFPAKKIGDPISLKVKSGDSTAVFKNILMGDLWLCSGQSNMFFELKSSAEAEKEIADATCEGVRFFDMKPIALGKSIWSKEQLEAINDLDYFSSSWSSCTPESAANFSAIAYHFGRKYFEETGVPVGLVHNSVGGSPTESWIDRKSMEDSPVLVDMLSNWYGSDFIQAFCKTRSKYNIQEAEDKLQRHPFHPTYLYDAGIKPIIGVPFKGVIWYQGESNAHNVELHELQFSTLVDSWRAALGDDLPFYFVQLSSINRPSWDHFRDSQRRLAQSIDNCEMVVSSDLGDPRNVHPTKKKPVGERLALVAMNRLFGMDVQWQGPTVDKVEYIGNRVVVTYKNAKKILSSDGEPLRLFEIAGEDEIYRAATVKIIGDNKVELISSKVAKPSMFRYGWRAYSDGNLINEAKLPASTFSTEY